MNDLEKYIIKLDDNRRIIPFMVNWHHYEIPNSKNSIYEAQELVGKELRKYGFLEKQINNFLPAIVEATQNIYQHTNQTNDKYNLNIDTVRVSNDFFTVCMWGDGPGKFNIDNIRKSLKDAKKIIAGEGQFGSSKMGTYIMYSVSDELNYNQTNPDNTQTETWLGIFKKVI